MTTFERDTRNSPDTRRFALQEKLKSFNQATTKGIVVDETQEANITFTRGLNVDQLPKVLKALLFVIGATSQNIRLEYTFSQRFNHPTQGNFSIKWDAKEDNGKAHEDSDDILIHSRSERRPIDIKSISTAVSESPGWEVKFLTNDHGSYVEYDERNYSFKSRYPELFARLQVINGMLGGQDNRLKLQEELVSLLDPTDPSANLDVRTVESTSYRQRREDQEAEAKIQRRVEALTATAKRILGEE